MRAPVPTVQDLLERTFPFLKAYSVNASRLTPAQKALKDRGIDQMLEEARADNKENDIEYMKPNGR